jgi:hypothetical protein
MTGFTSIGYVNISDLPSPWRSVYDPTHRQWLQVGTIL